MKFASNILRLIFECPSAYLLAPDFPYSSHYIACFYALKF